MPCRLRGVRRRALIHEQMVHSGLGLQPIVQIVPVGIAALGVEPVRRFADQTVPQVRVGVVVGALHERLIDAGVGRDYRNAARPIVCRAPGGEVDLDQTCLAATVRY